MTGNSANILVAKVLNSSTEVVPSPPSPSVCPFPSFPFSSSLASSSTRCTRQVLDYLIDSIISCLEEKDVEGLREKLYPNIQYKTEGHIIDNVEDTLSCISSNISSFSSLKFFVKRKIIDEEQGIIAVEAVTRTIPSRPSSPSSLLSSSPPSSTSPSSTSRPTSPTSVISERQIAWILKCDDDGKVKQWQTWKDPVWQGSIKHNETPLPSEVWHASCLSSSSALSFASCSSIYTRSYIENLMIKNSILYASNEMKKWEEECAHKDIIMHPPWDTLIGRDCCLKAASIFHSEYKDTVITPLRLIYDSMQPGIVAYQQIFQTTNRETGKIGRDEDYVFVEVVEGKIRYWRTYFDTGNSTQTTSQTFKSKVISASIGKEAR